MAAITWIKLTTDVFDDEKIKLIENMPEADSLLIIWIKLLTLAGKTNQGGLLVLTADIAYTDEMLATVFNRPLPTVRLALSVFQRFGMVSLASGVFGIANWGKHQNIDGMEKVRAQTRARVKQYRENQTLIGGNVTANVTVTGGNATDIDKDKEIDKTKKNLYTQAKDKNKKNPYTPAFEAAFADYPKRSGNQSKQQAFECWNARLVQGHKPEVIHAGVKRYRAYLRALGKEGSEFVLQARTFFSADDPPKFLNEWKTPPKEPPKARVQGAGWVDVTALAKKLGLSPKVGESQREWELRVMRARTPQGECRALGPSDAHPGLS
ncbi:MAG TPA: phage replisome organizer N-terminal domain-containing protein [Acidiferrobacterales bacterium]|nr:phage replisome organizer N-terminal domain-containing protein [Acidiferrobacterales bacterium]